MLAEFWAWLESLPLAARIGESWWFPLLESIHVVGFALLFGAILMVDLRWLGVAGKRYDASVIDKELTPWAWAAFVVSLITGLGLFMTRATHYAANPAFQAKFALLVLAGVNVLVFQFMGRRGAPTADRSSMAARVAGALSLLLWISALLAGRWVGHLS